LDAWCIQIKILSIMLLVGAKQVSKAMSITGDPSSSSWERSGEVRIDIPKDRDPYAKGAITRFPFYMGFHSHKVFA
jgi:hypothetical protein